MYFLVKNQNTIRPSFALLGPSSILKPLNPRGYQQFRLGRERYNGLKVQRLGARVSQSLTPPMYKQLKPGKDMHTLKPEPPNPKPLNPETLKPPKNTAAPKHPKLKSSAAQVRGRGCPGWDP